MPSWMTPTIRHLVVYHARDDSSAYVAEQIWSVNFEFCINSYWLPPLILLEVPELKLVILP